MYKKLNSENAFIWRITHRDNLSWYLQHGLHCPNSDIQAPNYVTIGNEDIIGARLGEDAGVTANPALHFAHCGRILLHYGM